MFKELLEKTQHVCEDKSPRDWWVDYRKDDSGSEPIAASDSYSFNMQEADKAFEENQLYAAYEFLEKAEKFIRKPYQKEEVKIAKNKITKRGLSLSKIREARSLYCRHCGETLAYNSIDAKNPAECPKCGKKTDNPDAKKKEK